MFRSHVEYLVCVAQCGQHIIIQCLFPSLPPLASRTRMPHFIDVVVKVCPEGLADATPSGRVIMGGSISTFRLDHFVNGTL